MLTHLGNIASQPYHHGIHAFFLQTNPRKLLNTFPTAYAMCQYFKIMPPALDFSRICLPQCLKLPLFHSCFQVPDNTSITWTSIADHGITNVASFVTHALQPMCLNAWRSAVGRIHHKQCRYAALYHAIMPAIAHIRAVATHGTNHTCCPSCLLHPWYISSSYYLDTMRLLHMNQPDLPRVQRQWAHLLLPSDQLHHSGYKHIWHSGIPRPFVDITYNILNNSLPTSCKALHCSNAPCPFCHAAADTIPHVLFECAPAVSLWSWACRIFRRWGSLMPLFLLRSLSNYGCTSVFTITMISLIGYSGHAQSSRHYGRYTMMFPMASRRGLHEPCVIMR